MRLALPRAPVAQHKLAELDELEQAQDAHCFTRAVIREIFGEDVADKIRIQYGGSVKPENTEELMSQADVDGALVGGASLDPVSFSQICKNANG